MMQREMDMNKEMGKKIEDLKPRLHMLTSQKMELNGRVIELQSTIASFKDDIKVVESNLHIKYEENKMLRDKITEILKEKDAEIEQLKQTNAQQLQQGVKVIRSMEDQLISNYTSATDKVVHVDVKRVEESNAQESDSVTKNLVDEDGQGQVRDDVRAGMKLEVPNGSKHGEGFRGDGKRGAMSRTKGRRWRGIARNRGFGGHHATAMTSRNVPQVLSNGELDHEKHDEEVRGTGLDNVGTTTAIEKTIDMEAFRAGQNLTVQTQVPASDGKLRTRVNLEVGNSTTEKANDTMSNNDSGATHKSRIEDDHHELNRNVENSDAVSQKVEFTDAPDELISSMENTTYRSLDSKTDDDLILHKEVKEHASQDTEESGNVTSGSEFEHDPHDSEHEREIEVEEEKED